MERRHWIAILCGGAMLAVVVGLRQSLGLFLTPISVELGLGRESFALGIGLMNLVWGLGAPFSGALADRYGAGRVAALGGVLYAGGLLAMTLGGQGGQLLAGGVLLGLGPERRRLLGRARGGRARGTGGEAQRGAWLAGYLYDLTGSYDLMRWLSVALGLASAALHWPIDERPVARLRPAAALGWVE